MGIEKNIFTLDTQKPYPHAEDTLSVPLQKEVVPKIERIDIKAIQDKLRYIGEKFVANPSAVEFQILYLASGVTGAVYVITVEGEKYCIKIKRNFYANFENEMEYNKLPWDLYQKGIIDSCPPPGVLVPIDEGIRNALLIALPPGDQEAGKKIDYLNEIIVMPYYKTLDDFTLDNPISYPEYSFIISTKTRSVVIANLFSYFLNDRNFYSDMTKSDDYLSEHPAIIIDWGIRTPTDNFSHILSMCPQGGSLSTLSVSKIEFLKPDDISTFEKAMQFLYDPIFYHQVFRNFLNEYRLGDKDNKTTGVYATYLDLVFPQEEIDDVLKLLKELSDFNSRKFESEKEVETFFKTNFTEFIIRLAQKCAQMVSLRKEKITLTDEHTSSILKDGLNTFSSMLSRFFDINLWEKNQSIPQNHVEIIKGLLAASEVPAIYNYREGTGFFLFYLDEGEVYKLFSENKNELVQEYLSILSKGGFVEIKDMRLDEDLIAQLDLSSKAGSLIFTNNSARILENSEIANLSKKLSYQTYGTGQENPKYIQVAKQDELFFIKFDESNQYVFKGFPALIAYEDKKFSITSDYALQDITNFDNTHPLINNSLGTRIEDGNLIFNIPGMNTPNQISLEGVSTVIDATDNASLCLFLDISSLKQKNHIEEIMKVIDGEIRIGSLIFGKRDYKKTKVIYFDSIEIDNSHEKSKIILIRRKKKYLFEKIGDIYSLTVSTPNDESSFMERFILERENELMPYSFKKIVDEYETVNDFLMDVTTFSKKINSDEELSHPEEISYPLKIAEGVKITELVDEGILGRVKSYKLTFGNGFELGIKPAGHPKNAFKITNNTFITAISNFFPLGFGIGNYSFSCNKMNNNEVPLPKIEHITENKKQKYAIEQVISYQISFDGGLSLVLYTDQQAGKKTLPMLIGSDENLLIYVDAQNKVRSHKNLTDREVFPDDREEFEFEENPLDLYTMPGKKDLEKKEQQWILKRGQTLMILQGDKNTLKIETQQVPDQKKDTPIVVNQSNVMIFKNGEWQLSSRVETTDFKIFIRSTLEQKGIVAVKIGEKKVVFKPAKGNKVEIKVDAFVMNIELDKLHVDSYGNLDGSSSDVLCFKDTYSEINLEFPFLCNGCLVISRVSKPKLTDLIRFENLKTIISSDGKIILSGEISGISFTVKDKRPLQLFLEGKSVLFSELGINPVVTNSEYPGIEGLSIVDVFNQLSLSSGD